MPSGSEDPSGARFWRTCLANLLFWMVVVGLSLRTCVILYLHSYDISAIARDNHSPEVMFHFPFRFGFETGAVAYSLATGHGFSSPFAGSTGPTAWVAPLYPALVALVFKVFGAFTLTAGFVMLFLNSVFAALNCIPIYRIAELTVGRRVGVASGWVWSAGLFFMSWPTTWIWEVSLSALLLSVLFLGSLRLASDDSKKSWVRFGALWGIAALTNPAILSFLPASGLYAAIQLRRKQRSWLRPVLVSAVVFMAVISPWLIRNRVVFGKWVFIRGNAPFEFALGNYHNSNGLGWYGRHPTQNRREWAKYAGLGEVAYVAEKKQEAMQFVKQHRKEFVSLCGTRIAAFWTSSEYIMDVWPRWFYWPLSAIMLLGLIAVLGYRINGGWLFFLLMFSYPLVYYITFAQPRYRHAIEPEMLLLSTYFVYQAVSELSARFSARPRPSLAGFGPVSEHYTKSSLPN
jgi:4-amino-4-deoxy-L-arabinose transferase-like glycosyltransferase